MRAPAGESAYEAFCAAWSAEVRRRGTAKEVARELGCSHRTVEGWDGTAPPQIRHLAAAVVRWGRPALERIFTPLLAADEGDLRRRLARVQEDMAFIVEHALAGSEGGSAEGLAHEDMDGGEGAAGAGDGLAARTGVALASAPGAALVGPPGRDRSPAAAAGPGSASGTGPVRQVVKAALALGLTVSLSWALVAGDRPDMRDARVRTRPQVQRVVRIGPAGAGGWRAA